MKNKRKKLLSLLLAVFMLVSLMPMTALAAELPAGSKQLEYEDWVLIPDLGTTLGGNRYDNHYHLGNGGATIESAGEVVATIPENSIVWVSGIYLTPETTGENFTVNQYGSVKVPAGGATVSFPNGDTEALDGNGLVYFIGTEMFDLSEKFIVEIHAMGGNLKIDGAEVEYLALDYGQSFKPADHVPEKEGHTFAGWYWQPEYSGAAGSTIIALKTGNEDPVRRVYAKWEVNSYAVTFDANYPAGADNSAEPAVTKDLAYGAALDQYLTAASEMLFTEEPKDGGVAAWRFMGWFTEADGGVKVETVPVAEDGDTLLLYAQWERTYTATLHLDGGELLGEDGVAITELVETEDTLVDLSGYVPERLGYTFDGWYQEETFETKVEELTFDQNHELYAKWLENFTLSFDSNGGTEYEDATVLEGEEVILPIPMKEGSVFVGWYKDAELTDGPYASIEMTESGTLYAAWETNGINTMGFKADGEDANAAMNTIFQELGVDRTIADCDVNTMYIFFDEALAEGAYYLTVTREEDGVLVNEGSLPGGIQAAYFTFNPEGGSTVNPGVELTSGNYVATLYRGTDETGYVLDTISLKLYELSFDNGIGEELASVFAMEGEEDVSLPVPVTDGYTFGGWYLDEDLETPVPEDFTLTNNTELYAKWTQNTVTPPGGGGSGGGGATTYTLTFETNGGSKISTVSKSKGTVIDLSAYVPTAEGYTFTGWYSDEDLTAKITSVTLNANTTIYAGWHKTGEEINRDDHFAYMQGNNLGYFRADDNMTRAEAAQMLYNLLLDKTNTGGTSYSDVTAKDWYYDAVTALSAKGLLNGYQDGSFKPNAPINRAEFVALLSRFSEVNSGGKTFTDVPSDHWAYAYISSAADKGWVNGYTDGSFKPAQNITRAEAAKSTNAMLERAPDKAYIDANPSVNGFPDLKTNHWGYYEIMEATVGHDFTKDSGNAETWTGLE